VRGDQKAMKYRADIDGLRALAVIPVVFYHLDVARFSGGFVGVDIFFVISGFLISTILCGEMQAGTYNIVKFYERRIRRIFPALFSVLAATMIGAWYLYLPAQFTEFSRSVVAAAFFVSNIFYYSKFDYFDSFSSESPLLHTWSLAVEEQFYIVFPILLWLIFRYLQKYRAQAVFLICVVSFAYSGWLLKTDSTAAFYMATSRTWELGIGAFLAIANIPTMRPRFLNEGLGIIGLGLLVFSYHYYSANDAFTGPSLAVPCLGAALLIYTGKQGTLAARILSLKPLVWIGFVSYSLYLWHWPLIVFYEYYFIKTPDTLLFADKAMLLALSTALAFLSWRYIEKPFRQKGVFSTRRIFQVSACAMAAITLSASVVLAFDGIPERFTLPVDKMASFLSYNALTPMREGKCFLTSRFMSMALFDKNDCLRMDKSRPNYLLIGDSHAADLWAGLHDRFPSINVMQATASGCKPIVSSGGQPRCKDLINFIFKDFLPTHHVDGLILSARWGDYDVAGVSETVKVMRKYATRVIVMGPTIEYKRPLPELLARRLLPDQGNVLSEAENYGQIAELDHRMAAALGGHYISILHLLCRNEQCTTADKNGNPLQFDYDHLTQFGSDYVASLTKITRSN
jgi:peptidoglycan/LPS O-acetylase OafA/YrhL